MRVPGRACGSRRWMGAQIRSCPGTWALQFRDWLEMNLRDLPVGNLGCIGRNNGDSLTPRLRHTLLASI
jgi:hypothetical protein